MFHFKICILVISAVVLLSAGTVVKKHRLFGLLDPATNTSTCLDHTLQDIKHGSCTSAANFIQLSQYLSGLASNQKVLTALRNQLNTVQTLKRNQRRHHGRTRRLTCETDNNNLRTDCRAAVSKMSPECSKLMCTLTDLYLNKFENLKEEMTWNDVATVLETIWSQVGDSCPTTHSTGGDCIAEVYSTAKTCYSDATKYTPANTGLTRKQRKVILNTLPLLEEIHRAFCEEAVCLDKLVQIMKNTHDKFKGTNCKITEQMSYQKCKNVKKQHLKNLIFSDASDHSTCAKNVLTKINSIATEINMTGKYKTIYEHGGSNPLYKIKLHYSIICELLLHYFYKGRVGGYTVTAQSYKDIVNQCTSPEKTTEINPVQTNVQALHVQVSHQNTAIEYNHSN